MVHARAEKPQAQDEGRIDSPEAFFEIRGILLVDLPKVLFRDQRQYFRVDGIEVSDNGIGKKTGGICHIRATIRRYEIWCDTQRVADRCGTDLTGPQQCHGRSRLDKTVWHGSIDGK